MALKLGELAAVIKTDNKPFEQGLGDAEGKFQRFGGRLRIAAGVAGAVAAAALSAALVGALDVDRGTDRLAAQLGATGPEAERLGAIAGDLYAGAWGDSMDEVNQAIRGVIQNIDGMEAASDPALQGITASVLDLTTAFDQDLNEATRAAGQLIRTGLAADATEALDLLTRGFQTGADRAGDLLEVVSEYSTMFREIGIDGEQAFGLISQGLAAGARDADTVADALKEFAIRAQDGSAASAEGFAAIGLSASEMTAAVAAGGDTAESALGQVLDGLRGIEDPAARNAAAVALFGTKAEDLGDALFALDLDSAVDELGNVEGAAAEMGDTLNDNAATQLESFRRSAQQALVEQLAAALPTIQAVAGWLTQHSAIVVPLVAALGSFAAIIGIILGVYRAWIILQTALNIVMSLNPLGLILIAIIALIAGIALLWANSETFRDIVTGVFGAVWDAIKFVWDWISDNWPLLLAILAGPIGLAVLAIVKNYDKIKAGVTAVKDWIVEKFNQVVGFVKGLPARVSSAASNLWDGIKTSFRSAVNWLIGKWNDFSLTLGGGSVLGMDIPSVTLSTPNISFLAAGGIVPATPGGRLAVLGEGGRDEAVAPLDRLEAMIAAAVRAGDGANMPGEMVAEATIDLGEGITKVVEIKLRKRDRSLRRRVLAGTGAAR